jgi:type VI secretion system protein VasD
MRHIFPFFLASALLLPGCKNAQKEAVEALAAALNPQPVAARSDDTAVLPRGPAEFDIKAAADAALNRDENGAPLSVVVRVFQLRGKTEFSRLSFDAAASGADDELFPKELAAANEMVLRPGDSVDMADKLLPETQYVGVVGYFRKPDARMWRFLADARAVRKEGLNFKAKECYLVPVIPSPEALPGQDLAPAPVCEGLPAASTRPTGRRGRR